MVIKIVSILIRCGLKNTWSGWWIWPEEDTAEHQEKMGIITSLIPAHGPAHNEIMTCFRHVNAYLTSSVIWSLQATRILTSSDDSKQSKRTFASQRKTDIPALRHTLFHLKIKCNTCTHDEIPQHKRSYYYNFDVHQSTPAKTSIGWHLSYLDHHFDEVDKSQPPLVNSH